MNRVMKKVIFRIYTNGKDPARSAQSDKVLCYISVYFMVFNDVDREGHDQTA